MQRLSDPAADREELLKMFPPDEDYRFRMNYRKVEYPRNFLAHQGDGLLAERNDILDAHPERHAGLLPEGEPHFDAFAAYVAEHGGIDDASLAVIRAEGDSQRRVMALARVIEPDFAIMRVTRDRVIRLVGGCVCFPSSWSPETKMGMELKDIHAVVPGLNEGMGGMIGGVMSHLKPGVVGMRADWSLKASTELNHHLLENRRLPDASATLDDSFIRVERQMMVDLPPIEDVASGIAFCIRYALYRIADMAKDPDLRAGVARALRTMPDDVADYKGLAAARWPLADALGR
jgi:hypothetical protein